MLYRRPAGILASLLLIPQLLAGSELACSRHAENEKPVAAVANPMEGHEHHQQSSRQDSAPSERHPVSDCCPAMSTCSSGSAIQVVDSALSSWTWHNGTPSEVETHSRSRVESPDPPPPKA